ncbi:hypothetical protein BDW67DRAFT_155998 [Aspergillus spinulosporus]
MSGPLAPSGERQDDCIILRSFLPALQGHGELRRSTHQIRLFAFIASLLPYCLVEHCFFLTIFLLPDKNRHKKNTQKETGRSK